MELTIDPVSELKNVKPTLAASVVAMNPIHESPWESFLGFRLGGGQRLYWRCKISRMIGTSLSQHPHRLLTKLRKVRANHGSIFQKNQTELYPGQTDWTIGRNDAVLKAFVGDIPTWAIPARPGVACAAAANTPAK